MCHIILLPLGAALTLLHFTLTKNYNYAHGATSRNNTHIFVTQRVNHDHLKCIFNISRI